MTIEDIAKAIIRSPDRRASWSTGPARDDPKVRQPGHHAGEDLLEMGAESRPRRRTEKTLGYFQEQVAAETRAVNQGLRLPDSDTCIR